MIRYAKHARFLQYIRALRLEVAILRKYVVLLKKRL